MAEQLALQQVLGNGGRVDGDEGTLGARGMAVQGTGHQLLARAARTGDQHRHMALAEAADGAEHILHGRGLSQDFLGHDVFVGLFGEFLALAFLGGTANELDGLGHIEGFGQVFEGTALKGRYGAVEVGKRRHHDDGQCGQALLHAVEQVQSREALRIRHADVADQHQGLAILGGLVECGQHLAGAREARHGKLVARQRLLQHEADGLVVIHDPD